MKIKHSGIWLFARVGATLAPFIFALLFFACKGQSYNKNQDQLPVVSKEEEMTFQMLKGEWSSKNFGSLFDVIPASGIPYTATAREINEKEKLILKVIRKDEKVPLCPIPKIISPSSNVPLLIGATTYYDEKNVFALTFKKVEVATPVKIRIYSEEFTNTSINRTYKDLTITVLPEPSIEGVTGGDISLPIGIDYDLSKESVTFTCTPSKIGELDASYYLLKDSKTITYVDSSSPNVATVTQEGVVKTLATGETNIKITTKNGKVGNIKVKVEEKKVPDSITCSTRKLTLSPGESQNITLVPSPHDAVLNLSEWTCTDTEVGKIEKIGSDELNYKITALKTGDTTFSAHSKYKESADIRIDLKVTDTKLESISIDPNTVSMQTEEAKQLKIVTTPDDASKAVRWESDKPETVSVSDKGEVKALKSGKATITATSLSDATKTATCTVTVTDRIEKIELNHDIAELLFKDTLQLTATISPVTAPQEIIWKTEKFDFGWDADQIAKVDKNGLVTAGEYRTGYVKVIATSKIDPSKKAECIVSVAGTKVSKIEVSETAIDMYTNTEKEITIEVFPAQAANKIGCDIEGDNLKAEYIVNMPTHPEKSTCKLKAGGIPEVKTITFYSLTNPEKKAKVKVNIIKPQGVAPTSFSVKSIEPDFVYYGDGGDATITLETKPEGSDAGFVFESENKDLAFVQTSDPNKYIIKVKNGKAENAFASFTVKSSVAPTLSQQTKTIEVKSVVPSRLEIIGDNKMYLDETLEFTVKTNDATPKPSRDVEWKIVYDDIPKEKIKVENISSTDGVRVSLIGDKNNLVDKSFYLIATSKLNDRVKAEKLIKIVKNIAKIESVTYDCKEYTCTTSQLNNKLYNGRLTPPKLKIKLTGNTKNQHLQFFISEKATLSKQEDYYAVKFGFSGNVRNIKEPFEYSEYTKTITKELKPNLNTEGKSQIFYVHPIDPKSAEYGKYKVPNGSYSRGHFSLCVWDEPTGIEVFRVENAGSGEKSFTIHKQDDGGYASEELYYKESDKYVFDVRTSPEYANPNYLEWETKRTSGNYMCILNPECSSKPDSNGKWRFKFNTNSDNTWGAHDWAKFLFYIRIPDENGIKQELSKPVSNYLLIDSN